jgi:hypothetical protein
MDRMDLMDRMDGETLQLRTKKDRIVNALLILLFLAIMGGAAYFIFKTMTHWNIDGLG